MERLEKELAAVGMLDILRNGITDNGVQFKLAYFKTAYLWEEIWQRDSWLDIVGRFIHLQIETNTEGGKKKKEERIIFPRFHQLDAVRQLEKDAKAQGTGKNYLIQHSAGR